MATYRALLSLKSSLDDLDSRLSALRLLNVFNRTFPPELSNFTNLRVLDLYNNNLTGVLPVSAIAIPEEEPKKSRSRESLSDWEGHRQEARRAAARATSETARGKSDWREARATGEKSRPKASQRRQRMKGFGAFGFRRGCE
ncbi:hypothetical protein ACLB2K_016776 [Fragaria x ananassa]